MSLGRRDKLGGGSGSHLHPIAVWCRWPTTRPESRLWTTRVGAVPGTPRCPGLTDATEHARRLPGVTLPRETRIRLPRGVHVSQWPGPPDPVLEQVLLPVVFFILVLQVFLVSVLSSFHMNGILFSPILSFNCLW